MRIVDCHVHIRAEVDSAAIVEQMDTSGVDRCLLLSAPERTSLERTRANVLCARDVCAAAPDRLSALARFWAALAGKTVPPDPRITRSRQKRAREMLRVLDGRASGATYRAIADAVFPKHDHDAA